MSLALADTQTDELLKTRDWTGLAWVPLVAPMALPDGVATMGTTMGTATEEIQ